jgi:putative hydrolase
MKVIGISDHGSKTDSLATEVYFTTLRRIPKEVNGIRLLKGIEADIISPKGDIDISDDVIGKLDYVMASYHPNKLLKSGKVEANTKVIINAIKQKKINILTHPFTTHIFPVDVKKISEEACRNNVLLEVNLHYIKRFRENKEIMSNLKNMVEVAKKNKKKIILGSDAHNIWELADDSILKGVKKEIGLTDNMIINNYPKELFSMLKI